MSGDTSPRHLAEALDAFLARRLSPAGFAIHYRIGDAFSGETEFHLRGDGDYELRSTATRERAPRAYSGRLEGVVVRELARALHDTKVWESAHVRLKPREDDPPATIAVEANGLRGEVELWVSEIANVPQFRTAQDSLLHLIRQVSEGQVLEEGR